MKNRFLALAIAALLAVPLAPLQAADGRVERIGFAGGATSTTIKGKVQGYHYVDYVFRAGAGQTLSVDLKKSNSQNYFNLIPPGAEAAMFIGSIGENFKGVLPADGDYTIRVYLMRAAARRHESSRYTLTVALAGQPLPAVPAATDALVPGTPFHATARIGCRHPLDPQLSQCEAGVVRRRGEATATVEVRGPDRLLRRILFVQGQPVASDSNSPVRSERHGDLSRVSLDGESYDIPDALLNGG